MTHSRPPGAAALALTTVKVVVVDVRYLIAEAFAALIGALEGFRVTGVISEEAQVARVAESDPDLFVVGVGGTVQPARELVRSIRARVADPQIVIVADTIDPCLMRFALAEEVQGVVTSDAPADDIAASLVHVRRGQIVLPAGWQTMLAGAADNRLEGLSDRQREVLALVVDGCSYEEIAERLCISLNTVKFHVRSIYSRLGVHNRAAAARELRRLARD